jgi:hypothetical protein
VNVISCLTAVAGFVVGSTLVDILASTGVDETQRADFNSSSWLYFRSTYVRLVESLPQSWLKILSFEKSRTDRENVRLLAINNAFHGVSGREKRSAYAIKVLSMSSHNNQIHRTMQHVRR